jgi:S-adenosylmethionine:tRNA ribosyltransferase-isomerase
MNRENYIPRIDLEKFDYELPAERIAEFPEKARHGSRLLVSTPDAVSHKYFYEINDFLPEDSLLVVNNTKVIAARLLMKKSTGGRAELLVTDPAAPSADPQVVMQARRQCRWECIVGGKRLREGAVLSPAAQPQGIELTARIISRMDNRAVVEFDWLPADMTFADVVSAAGKVPLPPYIRRDAVESDKESYQTVYAEKEGSVAAPTAGLHFTKEILGRLSDKNIRRCDLVLHVGPGTFRPIDARDIAAHDMHSEQIFVSRYSMVQIIDALSAGKRIIATGTTSVRTLESLYWHGAKIIAGEAGEKPDIAQWDPYRLAALGNLPDAAEAMQAVLAEIKKSGSEFANGRTRLFIVPGYEFRIVDVLITNFHLPKSTLILLVAAFAGEERWRSIYKEALANGYRFLSYGDSSLIFPG